MDFALPFPHSFHPCPAFPTFTPSITGRALIYPQFCLPRCASAAGSSGLIIITLCADLSAYPRGDLLPISGA